ncbi:MAG: glycosyltransferase family 2 protein [Kiritimatiellaceae bacterium]|nr:glycosyltransferase family 2 protein [Kiritimatiellaceae bacterium]
MEKIDPTISIVAPVYNEEEGIREFIGEVVKTMRAQELPWELVLVNDGSADRSLEILQEEKIQCPEIVWVDLSRNFGHQAAVTAAINHARGDAVVVMDADMQDPPSLIPELIASWRAGNQVVFAKRVDRSEKGLRRLGFETFHKVFRYTIDFPIPPDVGVFSLLDRTAVKELNQLPERNRFLPGLYSWVGFQQGFVEYSRDDRAAGTPKQTFQNLLKYAIDGVLSFSYKPIRLLGFIGIFTAVASFALALYFMFKRLLGYEVAFTGFTTLVILISGLGGLILCAVALVGEYVARIYDEVKKRPTYIVKRTSEQE